MLKVLLKKQMAEVFRGYFYNRKTNKARSKANQIILFILFQKQLTENSVSVGIKG